MELGPALLAVVNDARPVTLSVPITNGTFTYTPLAGDTAGPVSTYGPATGALQLSPGAPGAAPVVLLDGAPLAPHATPTDPGGPSVPGPSAGGPGASPPTVTPPGTAVAPQMKLVGRPRLRGRKLKAVLDLPGRGALALRVTVKRRTLGTAKASIRARGRRTITVKLKRRPPARVRLAIVFTPQDGAKQTRSVLVKRSR